jgi:hypothetical protein
MFLSSLWSFSPAITLRSSGLGMALLIGKKKTLLNSYQEKKKKAQLKCSVWLNVHLDGILQFINAQLILIF